MLQAVNSWSTSREEENSSTWQSQFIMIRRAMGAKKRNPGLVLTGKWWMQQHVKAQDLVKQENIHQAHPFPRPR
eukprot:3046210-Prorocentrum_lima.AAC.1